MLTPAEIARRRLAGQRLVEPAPGTAEVVAYLGAVQAQDYGGSKWGVGQRARGLTDAALDEAFDRGEIVRTHVLRPTWHFVAPADLRWMLALTGPRVHAANAFYYARRGWTTWCSGRAEPHSPGRWRAAGT